MQNPSPNTPIDEAAAQAEETQPTAPAGSEPKNAKSSLVGKMYDPHTRFGRFMRALTRTLALVVGFFALGVLAAYLLLYRPLSAQSKSNQTDLTSARQEVSLLQHSVSQAQKDVSDLKKTNQELSASLEQAKTGQALLSVQVAVSQARYGVAIKDAAAAKQALAGVPAALDLLAPAAGSANAAQIAGMRSRLALALGEIDHDPQTAASDLEILATQLTDLGKRMSGG
jgi:septal ring factor EnvC (AmiA/AmiB activator)